MRLLGVEVLAAGERDLLRDAAARIDQAVVRKRELGHIDRELEGPRERWPEWDFRCEDGEWADAKDGMCRLRSSSLPALEEKVRREQDQWPQPGGRRLPLGERLRVLAHIYGTTWDLLVDAADLAHMPDADRDTYAEAATSRAHAIGADPPPPAEEIHIWMATADRITRHVTIPRQEATIPLLMSVLHGMVGEPEHEQRASVLAFAQNSRSRAARG